MLVLSRKCGEIIRIIAPSGEIIDVELCETMRGKARIGVTAPDAYKIRRISYDEGRLNARDGHFDASS